jgi:hypothetical protein
MSVESDAVPMSSCLVPHVAPLLNSSRARAACSTTLTASKRLESSSSRHNRAAAAQARKPSDEFSDSVTSVSYRRVRVAISKSPNPFPPSIFTGVAYLALLPCKGGPPPPLEATCRPLSVSDPVFALGEFAGILSIFLCSRFIGLRAVALDCLAPMSNCSPPAKSPPCWHCWWPAASLSLLHI